ncbi:EamA family transporter RarD [Leuconostoc falkenbergense]|uniref:EamA family transporter RarD n=1 Tax=Leuconostoc falkenbergense TaxID=2766470 RepID=UPI002958B564|nr:EamA family transporter RarD [Leuconostoc falkenbergense]MDV8952165.1 EamA family transporter RarD [Leuconostoc falkenbergense]
MENKRVGIVSAISAYVLWGTLSIFWELLNSVPAMDTLAYRVVFSIVTIAIVLTIQRNWSLLWQETLQLIHHRKIYYIILSSFLIAINWFIYIYMVTHHQATEASLGYYIMPLMNVAVAVIILHEKLFRFQAVALLLVIIGVLLLTYLTGSLPVNTLLMAASFCFYGLIKKQIPLPATISLALETICVAPIAIIYLWLSPYTLTQNGSFVTTLLLSSGVITVIPLILFAIANKNTDFITLGFMQYLNPTIQLLMAIFVLHEHFQIHQAIIFLFIWAGILVFVIGSIHQYKHTKLY